jgi:hypothetical protein
MPTTPVTFSGAGAGGAAAALAAFEAAIGGANNGNTPTPQSAGFRTLNWDGVSLDGTDFSGDSIVIVPGKVVGIPRNRFERRGVFFEDVYAVSGDGFASTNSGVAGRFPAFSPANTFAPFNEITIGVAFVPPAPATTRIVGAATRGLGVVFLNNRNSNTSGITYFNGSESLGTYFAPTSATQGDPEFLGILFDQPIVTQARITCGTDDVFSFDGTTVTASNADSPPHNLVATDDFVYAEPTAPANFVPGIVATAGTPFTGTVAAFHEVAIGTVNSYTALIDWGDGQLSPGIITADPAGGFDVSGSNTYAAGGTFHVQVQVNDLLIASLMIDTTATVATVPTTTTTLPCSGSDFGAVACLLGELPTPACAGQTLSGPVTKLAASAQSLATRAATAGPRSRKRLRGKVLTTLGRAIAGVGRLNHVTGACPGAVASLLADARTRAQSAP